MPPAALIVTRRPHAGFITPEELAGMRQFTMNDAQVLDTLIMRGTAFPGDIDLLRSAGFTDSQIIAQYVQRAPGPLPATPAPLPPERRGTVPQPAPGPALDPQFGGLPFRPQPSIFSPAIAVPVMVAAGATLALVSTRVPERQRWLMRIGAIALPALAAYMSLRQPKQRPG